MVKILTRIAFGVVLIASIGSCSGSGSSSDSDANNAVGAAVGSVFGGSGSSSSLEKRTSIPSRLVQLFIRQAIAQPTGGMPSTCETLADNNVDGVTMGDSVTAGTYGANSNSITVTADQDCESDPAGTNVYATYDVSEHNMSCTDGSTTTSVTMTDGAGIWRNNTTLSQTEIYGSFSITSGDSSVDVNCSLTISDFDTSGNGTFGGDCEDDSGNAVDYSDSMTCTDT